MIRLGPDLSSRHVSDMIWHHNLKFQQPHAGATVPVDAETKGAHMAGAAKKTKAASKKIAKNAPASHPDDHVDGCLCGVQVPAHLYTRDEDLPPAKGGVASR